MFEVNSWVDQRFQVTRLWTDDGGMGTLLFVRDSHVPADETPRAAVLQGHVGRGRYACDRLWGPQALM